MKRAEKEMKRQRTADLNISYGTLWAHAWLEPSMFADAPGVEI